MEYRYKPVQKNKNALFLLFALVGLAALSLALGMSKLLAANALWNFSFLVFAVGALYVLLRYFCTSYLYVITDAWGEPTLVVSHVQGRRVSTQCRLGLSNLLRLVEIDSPTGEDGVRAMLDFRAERARYSYLASLGSVPMQILYGREGGVRFAIRLEGDAAFVNALKSAAERAALYAAEHGMDAEDADDDE